MCAYQAESKRRERAEAEAAALRSQLALVPVQKRGEDEEEPAPSGGAAQPTDVATPSLLTLPDTAPEEAATAHAASVIPPDFMGRGGLKHPDANTASGVLRTGGYAAAHHIVDSATLYQRPKLVRFLNYDPNKQVRTLTSLLPPHMLREEIECCGYDGVTELTMKVWCEACHTRALICVDCHAVSMTLGAWPLRRKSCRQLVSAVGVGGDFLRRLGFAVVWERAVSTL